MTYDATPSPTGKRAPHCRTCGSPMKGHSKGICSTGSSRSASGGPPATAQAQQGAAVAATIRIRSIMPGSYGLDRPSEVSVGSPTLLERIGPKLEETDLYYQLSGDYTNDNASTHGSMLSREHVEGLGGDDNLRRRLMPHPTLLDDELGPEHSISQVALAPRRHEQPTPSSSNLNANANATHANRSLAALSTSFSSWVAPPSQTSSSSTSTSVYDALSPRNNAAYPSSLPLRDLIRVTNAKQIVHVIELEHKFVRPVLQAAADAGVHAACIEREGSELDAYYSDSREPPNVRMLISPDAEAVARYRRAYDALTRNPERHQQQRTLFEAHDSAIGQIQESQEKLAKELKRRSCAGGMGLCSMIGAGAVGAFVLLFVMAYS